MQRFLVISGANEEELRTIFHLREIKSFFNYGIFGSPESKDNIIVKKIQDNSIIFPALYIGDSKYDHVVSKDNNLDFVFISGWTEFDDWEQYCKINNLESFKSLSCVFK